MNRKIAALVLLGGLTAATLGMALVALGVVIGGLFFAGIYLLAAGLFATAVGSLLHLTNKQRA